MVPYSPLCLLYLPMLPTSRLFPSRKTKKGCPTFIGQPVIFHRHHARAAALREIVMLLSLAAELCVTVLCHWAELLLDAD